MSTLISPEPLISVVTIVKDHAEGFARTAQSILSQTNTEPGKDVEWIVVNGSTKNDDVAKLIDANSDVIAWSQSKQDKGLYNAMNIGLDQATGQYVIFMNAGDTFAHDDVMIRTAEIVEQDPACDFIYGDFETNDRYIKARPLDYKWGMATSHQSMLYKRDVIGDQRYDEKFKICGDFDFTERYMKRVHDPKYAPFAICHFEGGGVSSKRFAQTAKEAFDVRREHRKAGIIENAARTLYGIGLQTLYSNSPTLFRAARTFYRTINPRKPHPSEIAPPK